MLYANNNQNLRIIHMSLHTLKRIYIVSYIQYIKYIVQCIGIKISVLELGSR